MDAVKILLVEDDRIIASLVKKYLDIRGYAVNHAEDGVEGMKEFDKADYDLIIMDVMMPHKDGYTLAEEIRAKDPYIPILFMSSNNLPKDKIKAFRIGADDYVTKPVNVEELLLRIEVILKRQKSEPKVEIGSDDDPHEIKIGNYILDFPYQKLQIGDDTRKLTTREAELLRFLHRHRNSLIKREYILQEVWGDDDYYKGRSLDVFMSRLRKYLKDDPTIEILNVHGIGFKFLVQD
ncbi:MULTISPECIES: response regulator transcription factor [Flammeovirga]|uniref:Response regulator transcription factor n=1 Tax=Flammeovirga agarivorans TaxID=2726742 RepID=A0A7X8XX05_9BACT|nr:MULTISPECIES: response regulator transcription factor [Flammeovirga]NLR92734.1 response regulator transcription factor [Flammeovirga agarivorans]